MPKAWRDPLVWKRGVSLFGLLLLIALGLCGLNLVVSNIGKNSHETTFILLTGALETLAILLGALGLLISLVGLAITSLFPLRPRD